MMSIATASNQDATSAAGQIEQELLSFAKNERESMRMQERFRRIITANLDHIAGKRILDLACNNGRWSYAAAAAGGKEVIGVEGRAEYAEEARQLVERKGLSATCRFDTGDMYDWLYDHRTERFDTVLCLGVYYHIMDHYSLLRLIARLQPECIIIDSGFVPVFDLSIKVHTENPSSRKNALPAFEGQEAELAAHVSLGLMNQMAWNCGYICEPVVWEPKDIPNRECVSDYMHGRRFTLRLTRNPNVRGGDRDWLARWQPACAALGPRMTGRLRPESPADGEEIARRKALRRAKRQAALKTP